MNSIDTLGMTVIMIGAMTQIVRNVMRLAGRFWRSGLRRAPLSRING